MQTKNKITKSLQKKLVIFNSVLIILIMLVNIILFVTYNNMNYREYITLIQYNTVAQIGNSYETIIDYVQSSIIKKVYQEKEVYNTVMNYDSGIVGKLSSVKVLEELVAQESFINSVYLYLRNENVVISSTETKNNIEADVPPEEFFDFDIISRLAENSSYISPPRTISPDGGEMMVMTMAIDITQNGRSGVLMVNIDIDKLGRQIINKNTLKGLNIKISIADADGNIFYEYNHNDEPQRAIVAEYYSQRLGWNFTYCQNSEAMYYIGFKQKIVWFMFFSVIIMVISVCLSRAVIKYSTKPVGTLLKNYCDDFWITVLTSDTKVDEEVLSEVYRQGFDLSETAFFVAVCENGAEPAPNTEMIKTVQLAHDEQAMIIKYDADTEYNSLFDNILSAGNKACVGRSSVKDSVIYIHNAYLEAKDALNYKLYTNERVIEYENVRQLKNDYIYDFKTEKRILNNLATGNSDSCTEHVHTFFDALRQTQPDDSKILNAVYQLQNAVYRQMSTMPISIEVDDEVSLASMSLSEIEEGFADMVESICRIIRDNELETGKYELYDAVMEAIDADFAKEEFGLDYLVKMFGVSKNEISKIVKLKTQESFPEYMNHKKIEYAKKLLVETDDTVEKIASKAGFSYSYYFIKVFKESEGITPKQYRMHKRRS